MDRTVARARRLTAPPRLAAARRSRRPTLPRAKEFYAKPFAWTFAPLQGTDQAVEIRSGDRAIGTLRVAEGAISAFNGVVYVQVDDMQDSWRTSKELGATQVPGFPFNLPDDGGAVGLVLDPSGHPVGLYSRAPLPRP